MKVLFFKVVVPMALLFASSMSIAQTEEEWIVISEPDEVRKLISGRAMDAQYWIFYFRSDGKMSYWQDGYDLISVREWSINEKGEICMSVYSMPDRIIDCQTVQKSSGSPIQYQLIGNRSAGSWKIRFTDPAAKLIDAVTQRAGAEE